MDRQESKVAHLTLIQGVIARLAQNSFALKGWAVLLLSGLFGLAAAGTEIRLAYVAYIPCIVFWLLDAYYLRQERLFRSLYDDVAERSDVDFSMDTSTHVEEVVSVARTALSATLGWFYGALLLAVVAVTIVGS